MTWAYIVIPPSNATGLQTTPVISGSASHTAASFVYGKSAPELIEEIEELRAFAAAMSATGEDAEIIPFDQAIHEIENRRR